MEEQKESGPPFVTYLFLATAALVMVYVSLLPPSGVERFYRAYAFSASSIFELSSTNLFENFGLVGLFTYMFLHASWMHFLMNAVALLGAGIIVEREIGSIRYVLVYLFSGISAAITYSLLHMSSADTLIGASGAIFGVIAVLFLLMPFKITFTLVIPLPSVLVGIMLSLVEFSAMVRAQIETGVAHEAHLAGFLFGGILAFAIDRRRAMKGLIIAVIIFLILYYLGIQFRLLQP